MVCFDVLQKQQNKILNPFPAPLNGVRNSELFSFPVEWNGVKKSERFSLPAAWGQKF